MSNIPQSSKAEARMVIKDAQTQETIPWSKNKAIMTNKMRVANKTTNTLVFCKV